MLKIVFTPADYSDGDILLATYVYMFIWENDGEKIVKTAETVSGLRFREKEIEATVHKGNSRSHPLTLSAYSKSSGKRASLIHELLHRLLVSNSVSRLKVNENKLEAHKVLDLILYDILNEVYGKRLADWAVNFDKTTYEKSYAEAWDWALSFDKDSRRKEFQKIVNQSVKTPG